MFFLLSFEFVKHLTNAKLAGLPGFEPGNHGTKTRCLTAWL
jgi:hypothetical protein